MCVFCLPCFLCMSCYRVCVLHTTLDVDGEFDIIIIITIIIFIFIFMFIFPNAHQVDEGVDRPVKVRMEIAHHTLWDELPIQGTPSPSVLPHRHE